MAKRRSRSQSSALLKFLESRPSDVGTLGGTSPDQPTAERPEPFPGFGDDDDPLDPSDPSDSRRQAKSSRPDPSPSNADDIIAESGVGLSPMIREAEQAWIELISSREPAVQTELRRRLRHVRDEFLQGRQSPILRLLAERLALTSLSLDWLDAMAARSHAHGQAKLAKRFQDWQSAAHQRFLAAANLFAVMDKKVKR